MDKIQAARKLRPGTSWNMRGNVLEQADDGTARVIIPTETELQPIMKSDSYLENRKKEYPSIEDQLQAIWDFISAQQNLPKTTSDLLSKIQAVNLKYPKGDVVNASNSPTGQ